MKKWIIFLSITLFVQIVLALGLNLAQTDYSAFQPQESLFSFDAKIVTAVKIESDENKTIELVKKKGQWFVSQLNNFPADQQKINRFIEKIAALKKGWPVATSTAAAERFKVNEDAFERKITFYKASENIGTLYVGTSPTFRKVHARRAGEKSVYAVEFNAFDAGVKTDDWIDSAILTHKASEIARVKLPDFDLIRQEGKIVVKSIDGKLKDTIEDKAEHLLNQIAGLHIRSVLGRESKVEYNSAHPVFKYTLEFTSGKTESYVFSKSKGAEYYILKPSHWDEYFKVDRWVVNRIQEVGLSKLVQPQKNDRERSKDAIDSKKIEPSKPS